MLPVIFRFEKPQGPAISIPGSWSMSMWAPSSACGGTLTRASRALAAVALAGPARRLRRRVRTSCAPSAPAVTHYAQGTDPAQTAAARRHRAALHVPARRSPPTGGVCSNSQQARCGDGRGAGRQPRARLRRRRACARARTTCAAATASSIPQVDADAAATRQRYSAAQARARTRRRSIFNLFTLSASVSYALDVFGGERRMVEALRRAGATCSAPPSRPPISR